MDHESALHVIIGKGKPDDSSSGDSEEMAQAHNEAANELISAVKSKDAEGVVEAFKTLYQLCDSGSDEGEYE